MFKTFMVDIVQAPLSYLFLAEAFCGLRPEAFCGFLLMSAPACLTLWTLTVDLMVHETALGAGDGAADHQHVQLGVDLHNAQVLDSHLLHAHVPAPMVPLMILDMWLVAPREPI